MRLHDLKPAPGANRDRKRLGRGNASGQGTTAGKGTKGEKARKGGIAAGFRGISSRNFRLAKRRGFNNRYKTHYEVVNLDKLSLFESGATVNPASLKAAGLVHGNDPLVKILGNGELANPLTFAGVRISASARAKIQNAGGTIEESPAADEEDSGA
jgi:large subunit ribosomal protein L15